MTCPSSTLRATLLPPTLVVLLLAAVAHAHPRYQARIPNGALVRDAPGVGHVNPAGTGKNNAFGLDFAAAGHAWTRALCEKDSDGDGLSNGLELGDPSCTWAKGATPQFDTGITHPGIATSENVAREVKSCTADYTVPAANLAETAVVNLTFPGYAVPAKDTTYAKYAFNMQDEVKRVGLSTSEDGLGSYFGIRFGIIKNSQQVHHLILYGCATKPKGELLTAPSENGKMSCESVRYAWAVGGDDFCLPESVGIEFPVADRAAAWHVVEIHYDNPQGTSGIVDTSGVTMQLVRKKAGVAHAQVRSTKTNLYQARPQPQHSQRAASCGIVCPGGGCVCRVCRVSCVR